jgi:hypothetical protein
VFGKETRNQSGSYLHSSYELKYRLNPVLIFMGQAQILQAISLYDWHISRCKYTFLLTHFELSGILLNNLLAGEDQ